jgi:hypothetical protein
MLSLGGIVVRKDAHVESRSVAYQRISIIFWRAGARGVNDIMTATYDYVHIPQSFAQSFHGVHPSTIISNFIEDDSSPKALHVRLSVRRQAKKPEGEPIDYMVET